MCLALIRSLTGIILVSEAFSLCLGMCRSKLKGEKKGVLEGGQVGLKDRLVLPGLILSCNSVSSAL